MNLIKMKEVLNHIEQNNLDEIFKTQEEKIKWAKIVSKKDILYNNFLNTKYTAKEIKDIRNLLIDLDFLSLSDYIDRFEFLLAIFQAFEAEEEKRKVSKKFLISPYFFYDIDFYANKSTLYDEIGIFFTCDTFITSPYHMDDLKIMEEVIDEEYENKLEILLKIAANEESINSEFHEQDMKFIATFEFSYYVNNLTDLFLLATNEISLKDKYHLENMKILSLSISSYNFLLFQMMTDEQEISSKFYREEINLVLNARNIYVAEALFHKIMDFDDSYKYKENSSYLDDLKFISNLSDEELRTYTSLLMNLQFEESSNKRFDLELLKKCEGRKQFAYLLKIVREITFLESKHHKEDALLISTLEISNEVQLGLVLSVVVNQTNINSINHRKDIEYILSLDFTKLTKEIISEIEYYLLNDEGINAPNRIEKMNILKSGKMIGRDTEIINDYERVKIELYESTLGKKRKLFRYKKANNL